MPSVVCRVATAALVVVLATVLVHAVPMTRSHSKLQGRLQSRSMRMRVSEPKKCDGFDYPVLTGVQKEQQVIQDAKFLKHTEKNFVQNVKHKDGKVVLKQYELKNMQPGTWVVPSANDAAAKYKKGPFVDSEVEWQSDKDAVELVPVVWSMLKWAEDHALPVFDAVLRQFARDEWYLRSRDVKAIVAPVKAMASAVPKIGRDYGGNPLKLVDAVRGSLVYQKYDDLVKGICQFHTWLKKTNALSIDQHKCKVLSSKNRLEGDEALPSGYKDFMITLACDVGPGSNGDKDKDMADKDKDVRTYLMEIQFHYCAYMMVKQGDKDFTNHVLKTDFKRNGHTIYDEIRPLGEFPPVMSAKFKDENEWKKAVAEWHKKIDDANKEQADMYKKADGKAGETCPMNEAPKWESKNTGLYDEELKWIEEQNAEADDVKVWHSKDYHSKPLVGFDEDWAKVLETYKVANKDLQDSWVTKRNEQRKAREAKAKAYYESEVIKRQNAMLQ